MKGRPLRPPNFVIIYFSGEGCFLFINSSINFKYSFFTSFGTCVIPCPRFK